VNTANTFYISLGREPFGLHLFDELRQYSVGESEHLHQRFPDTRIPSLQEVVELFKDWPRAQAVVETAAQN